MPFGVIAPVLKIDCGGDGFGFHAVDAVALGEPPTRNLLAERCVIWNEHAGNEMRLGASLETTLSCSTMDRVFRDTATDPQ